MYERRKINVEGIELPAIGIGGKEYISVNSYFDLVGGLSYGQGGKFARANRFPAFKFFGKWYALKEDLDNFLKENLKYNDVMKENK